MVDGVVEYRRDVRQIIFRVIVESIHFDSLPFARLTTPFAAHRFARHKTSVPMQPAAEHDVAGDFASGLSQIDEDGFVSITDRISRFIETN